MAYVPLEDVLTHNDSLYKLVLLAAKRALEISDGAPPLVATTSKQPGTVALEEIREGKVSYRLTAEAKDTKETKKKREKSA